MSDIKNINDLLKNTNIKIQQPYSSQCISNNNFNGIIYKKVDDFDDYFCKIIEKVISSFKMSYQNNYKSLNINIPNIRLNQTTKLHFHHIIDDEIEPLQYKIKRAISKYSTYFILEYSTYSKHKYIIDYVNDCNYYGNITKILEDSLLQNKRIYTLSHKYNKVFNEYYLRINENLIFSLLVGFMLNVYKLKFFNKYNIIKYDKLIFENNNQSIVIKPLIVSGDLSLVIKYFYNYDSSYLNKILNFNYYENDNYYKCILSKNIIKVLNEFII